MQKQQKVTRSPRPNPSLNRPSVEDLLGAQLKKWAQGLDLKDIKELLIL